ncbi:uncharacterized protein EI90DRAFT_3143918 [Cantharellus anzutake]|uniref:uncharacterized protein n=1 Tax=Cantharellus anzutake TaxID=1750568 RepID=UPI001906FDF1|nr:uncharacterized protein EI90DRAFT_3143918 [Cantharellus anzutake]KAF8340602.1 hypothetical protein EI90DRAFT_3143918 [Cantharellus anzutake]
MAETELAVGPASEGSVQSPKTKPTPEAKSFPLKFTYSNSEDGIDENLLVLLHGLGDTETPFAGLARRLRLPQTATLSLRAPDRIPFFDEDAFQWYRSFDLSGELLERPDPTPALEILDRVIEHLTVKCSWPINRIHLFGFAQGGSVASELALRLWRKKGSDGGSVLSSIASVVSIDGPLLSYPTFKPPCATPAVYFHRSQQGNSAEVAAFQKGFADMRVLKAPVGGGMPKSKEEWSGVIQFWGRVLASRMPDMEGLHPIISGGPTLPTQSSRTSHRRKASLSGTPYRQLAVGNLSSD